VARPARPHAVILAGGAGERFWPASRSRHPKPFLEVVGEGSLLDATVARARRFARRDGVWVVCGEEHARAVRRETGLPARRVLVEPRRRNTAAAVAFAAHRIAAEDPQAVFAVLPADHYIPDADAFAADIRRAAKAAGEAQVLVTLGVRPTRPETGYGYIELGAAVGRGHARLRRVRRFVEKPDAARARRFLKGGRHLWNAGIFVWRADSILEEIERFVPALSRAFAPLTEARRPTRAVIARAYARAPSLPIDVGVMERSRRVWTLPVRWHWSDVGTWESLAGELGVAPGRSRLIGGSLVHDDRGGNLVWGRRERPIALLGVEGLAVVDTGDALLVARLERSNDVREIVKALKAGGRPDVT
jgi:mannose-1-phosphate guanylyltransferase